MLAGQLQSEPVHRDRQKHTSTHPHPCPTPIYPGSPTRFASGPFRCGLNGVWGPGARFAEPHPLWYSSARYRRRMTVPSRAVKFQVVLVGPVDDPLNTAELTAGTVHVIASRHTLRLVLVCSGLAA